MMFLIVQEIVIVIFINAQCADYFYYDIDDDVIM